MTALEALAVARAEGVAVRLADDGAHIRYRSRGKAPSHVLEALRAAKPEIVALLRYRLLYAHREREHVRSFRAQMVIGGCRGLIPRVERLKKLGYAFAPTRRGLRGFGWPRKPSSTWRQNGSTRIGLGRRRLRIARTAASPSSTEAIRCYRSACATMCGSTGVVGNPGASGTGELPWRPCGVVGCFTSPAARLECRLPPDREPASGHFVLDRGG
jgi:hypothetical protein